MKLTNTRRTLVVLLFLLITGNVYSQVPVADFTVDDPSGCAPFINATFHSTSTNSPNSFTWDFGDGGGPVTVGSPDVQHNYALPGSYTVTLTASNGSGASTPAVKISFITVFKNPVANYSHSPDSVCSGVPMNFTDQSTPGDAPIITYVWSFQDGTPRDTINGVPTNSHAFLNNTGQIKTYTPILTVIDTNGCNSGFGGLDVYAYPQAFPDFGIGPGTSCSIPATYVFTNSSTGPTIYNWDFGDPSSGVNDTSSNPTPSHIFNASGSYLVSLTSGYPGCTVTDTMTLNVQPPVAAFSVSDSIACLGETVVFTNMSSPAPLSAMTYNWTFGGVIPPQTGIDASIFYTVPAVHPVTLTVHLGSCTSTVVHNVLVPASPNANFTATDHSACNIPFDITFNSDTTSNNIGWQWDFGDPASGASNTSSFSNPVHTYNNFGTYTVKLVVTDIFGCRDSSSVFNYVLIQKPVIDFIDQDSGCVGKIFNYTSSVISPADPVITNYSWDFGDGSPVVSGSNPDTSHQFNSVGIFDVTLTITTQSGCQATLTKLKYARVGTPPSAQIDSVPSIICFKGNVGFNDLTPQPVTGWLWMFGDGQSSNERNPNHQYKYDTSGVAEPFDIILIAYYNGCADTDTVVNMVTVLPPLTLFDSTFNCINPDSVNFTNLTGGFDSLWWNFGDGSAIDSVSLNPFHIFPGSGDYSVKLTAKNNSNGCVIDTTLIIPVRNIQAFAQSNVTETCVPAIIDFTGSNSADAAGWFWTFGEGIPGVRDTSFEADTIHIYSRPGYYTATLNTIDMHGCTAVDTQRVHILGPTPYFTASPTGGCAPILVTFKDSSQIEGSNIVSWIWDFGTQEPIDSSTVDSILHIYSSAGLYTIRLTVRDGNGCTNSYSNINYINPTKPSAGITIPPSVCKNTPAQIIGSPGIPNSGTYAEPVTYSWDFGDGQSFSDTSKIASHSYTGNGNYTITLRVQDANGCRDTTQQGITIHGPKASFHFTSTSDCLEIDGILKALVHAQFFSDSNTYVKTWYWNLKADSGYSTSPAYYAFDYNVPPGNYDATLIVTDSAGCSDAVTESSAIVVTGPTGSFTFSPDSGCPPLTVNFHGSSSSSLIYAWDFGDGTVLNDTPDSIVQHTYISASVYNPQFYVGFQVTNSICYIPVPPAGDITVTSPVGVNIVEDTIYVPEGSADTLTVIVTNPPPSFTYVWNPSDHVVNGPTSNTFLASIEEGSAYYTVKIDDGSGCANGDKVLVIFLKDTCELGFNPDSIPNVFTPDGNSFNDTYYIKNLCNKDNFHIKIFNRWGKIVYESSDINFHWDGTTTGGTEASEGVYYYIFNTKSKEYHGYIELIRGKK